MRFEIVHETEYRYSEPVFLEPHLLRIRPRSDWSQRLIRFDLQISPQPESYWGHVNPIGPRSMYDESERFGEALAVAFWETG